MPPAMSFADTYGQEVIESRRIRSERARFWAKLVGFALMLLVAVTLRSEPELRSALVSAGVERLMALRGEAQPDAGLAIPSQVSAPTSDGDANRVMELLERMQPGTIGRNAAPPPPQGAGTVPNNQSAGIRVNRHSATGGPDGPRFIRVAPAQGD